MINDALNIGKKFLDDMDKFIANNYRTLKCNDISDIYSGFFNDLKEFRGTSSGFTGLSEFLIFRCLHHQLGSEFEKKPITKCLYEFSKGDIRICQCCPVAVGESTINERQINPDITIYHSGELIAVIRIKVYLTKGIEEVTKEIDTLEKLKSRYPKLQALLIIFSGLSKKGKIFRELEEQKNIKDWFNFLILKENKEPLMQKLQQYLGLERITATSPNIP